MSDSGRDSSAGPALGVGARVGREIAEIRSAWADSNTRRGTAAMVLVLVGTFGVGMLPPDNVWRDVPGLGWFQTSRAGQIIAVALLLYGVILLLDACIRLLPGVMGAALSGCEESFENGLLEYPHYTRPASWEGRTIPEVLRSGDHAKIAAWRKSMAEVDTRSRRPDLWERHEGARVQPASGARQKKKD